MTLYREIEGSLPRRISSADQDQASEQPPGADGVLPEVTVVLADDQVATRAGVRRALAPHGFRIVAEVENAADAVIAALEHRPDVCMLEVRLPGNGIEAARRISDELPEAKIVMLTASERHDDLVAALRAGADGYLLKTTSADRLPYAIRGVLRGEAALSVHTYFASGLGPRATLASPRSAETMLTAPPRRFAELAELLARLPTC